MTSSKPFLEEILLYFHPIKSVRHQKNEQTNSKYGIGNLILKNLETEPLKIETKIEIAIFCIDAPKSKEASDKAYDSQQIREEFYKLRGLSSHLNIADLGDLKTGYNITDALFALQEVSILLNQKKITSIIMGGNQLYTLGCYLGYKVFENNINLAIIDSKPDMGDMDDEANEHNFLSYLLEKENGSLYNVSLIGYQRYLSEKRLLNQFSNKYFEAFRLGYLRQNLKETEIILRDADLVSFDLSAIRHSDAPGQLNIHPNGFYAEEACALARYAGLSDRTSSFGLFGYVDKYDTRGITAMLSAEIIWHFIDGYLNRKHDFPVNSIENYKKIVVAIDEIDFPVVFYLNEASNRWWMEVSNSTPDNKGNSIIISSCEEDYKLACNNELCERWWLNFKKLN